ncbi:MAG: hypothetical protein M1828_002997 [Chrysothrix sp. TS-e1954]|nr:MAG: hypothetical protein M1828_002997 [Chrysothrix sp. TS-e1954]
MEQDLLDASQHDRQALLRKQFLSLHWPPMRPTSGGMQVHAVPDDERALDTSGRPLPWGYSYADASLNRKFPVEHGPFGKSTSRRTMSRSKTATPATKEDVLRLDNQRVQDEVFSKFKSELEEQQQKQPNRGDQAKAQTRSSLQPSRSSLDVIHAPAASTAPSATVATSSTLLPEPSEVLLYGFAADQAYAAIDFYENASNGRVYEDYDRLPPHPRYMSALSSPRSHVPRTLPREARRKINEFKGGDHWIKVTFDSPQAAELACHISPHVINGFSVFAERWRDAGPSADVAISAIGPGGKSAGTVGRMGTGAQTAELSRREFSSLPARRHAPPGGSGSLQRQNSGNGLGDSTSSTETADGSSATATGSDVTMNGAATAPAAHRLSQVRNSSQPNTQAQQQVNQRKPLKIPTATRLVLQPASAALLPLPPWTQRTFGHLPIIGPMVGGSSTTKNVIGAEIPRNEKGEFDWDRASLWWRVCWWLDGVLGTDLCGVKGED